MKANEQTRTSFSIVNLILCGLTVTEWLGRKQAIQFVNRNRDGVSDKNYVSRASAHGHMFK